MRKFIPALESVQEPLVTISLEDELLLVDECARNEAQIANDMAEVNKGLDLSDALEDLAIVAGQIKSATKAETDLTDMCSQMATAGSDVKPDEFLPSMESYRDQQIATEGFKERAKQIWESIQKYIKHIWDRIVAFFKGLFQQVPAYKKRLAALKKTLEGLKRGKAELKDKAEVRAFAMVGHKPVTDAAEYVHANDYFTQIAGWVFGDYAKYVLALGEKAKVGIAAFDPQDPSHAATEMRYALAGVKLSNLPGLRTARDVGKFKTEQSEEMLQNKLLIVADYGGADESTTLGTLEKLRTSHVMLTDSRAGHELASHDHDGVKPLSIDQMLALVKGFEAQLDQVDKFQSSRSEGEFARVKKELSEASNVASKAMAELDKDDTNGHHTTAETYFRAMLNFNPAFLNWVDQPLLRFSSVALSNVRHGIGRVAESLKCYVGEEGVEAHQAFRQQMDAPALPHQA